MKKRVRYINITAEPPQEDVIITFPHSTQYLQAMAQYYVMFRAGVTLFGSRKVFTPAAEEDTLESIAQKTRDAMVQSGVADKEYADRIVFAPGSVKDFEKYVDSYLAKLMAMLDVQQEQALDGVKSWIAFVVQGSKERQQKEQG